MDHRPSTPGAAPSSGLKARAPSAQPSGLGTNVPHPPEPQRGAIVGTTQPRRTPPSIARPFRPHRRDPCDQPRALPWAKVGRPFGPQHAPRRRRRDAPSPPTITAAGHGDGGTSLEANTGAGKKGRAGGALP